MAAAQPAGLRVGMAETDITPPEGFLMAGYYHERKATGRAIRSRPRPLSFRERPTRGIRGLRSDGDRG